MDILQFQETSFFLSQKLTGHKKSVRITQVREEAGSDGPRMGRFKKPEDTKSGTEGEKSIPRVEAETAENLL